MSFSATEAAFEGFRLARHRPLAVLAWALMYLVVIGLAFAVAGTGIASLMAGMQELQGNTDPQPQDLQPLARAYASLAWLAPVSLVLSAVLSAAVARAVLRPSESAFGYLRLGMDELRVLAVSLVLGILGGLFSALLAVSVGIAAALVGASGQEALWLLVVLAGLFAVFLIVWLLVRFSLAIPITIAERRMAIFDSFGVTRGRALPLAGMAVIAAIMSMIVSALGLIVAFPVTLATGGLQALAAMEGQPTMELLRTAAPAIIAWTVVNAIMSALQLAILYAPFSAAYREIKAGG